MKDTAYTAEALDAHTDTTYFRDPVGYQMFHLLSHTDGDGGKSLLVDGLHCAAILAQEDFEAFRALCSTYVHFHASGNEGISMRSNNTKRVLSASYIPGDHGSAKFIKLTQVIWNRYDRATYGGDFRFSDISSAEDSSPAQIRAARGRSENAVKNWYAAARKWNEILKRPENEYWEQLKPGRPLSKFASLSMKSRRQY